jgi:uncharacterized protein (DUF2236 family)
MAQPLTDDFLDAKRQVGDEEADRVVAALIEARKVDEVDRDLLAVLRNNDPLPADLPETVHDYFEQTEGPLQVDADALRRAQQVFATYGPEILMVLGFYALPAAYAARKGVQVLYRTAFLAKRPVRRVFETSRMVAEVMAPDGLAAAGEGLRIIEKVRLMHAGIRTMLQQDEEHPWDPSLGVPINQEDMAGTLMTFSYIVVSGLEQLHIELDPADADAWLQTWFAIGRRMGVHEDLIPANREEAEELTRKIRKRQIAGSPEGIALTKALIDGYADFEGLPKSAPASMVHFFLDDDALMHQNVAEMLEVPPARWFSILPRLLIDFIRAFTFLLRRGPVQAGVLRWLSRHLVAGLLEVNKDASGATFSIPDHLHDDWKLPVKGAKV